MSSQYVQNFVLLHLREKPFVSATKVPEWLTLTELASRLDESGYWSHGTWSDSGNRPPDTPAIKRRHVRQMLEYLWSTRDTENPLPDSAVFLSRFVVTDEGEFERVFKQASLCGPDELTDLADEKLASREFEHHRLDRLGDAVEEIEAGYTFSLGAFYMQELSEATMRSAWPALDAEGREWVAGIGAKLYASENKMVEDLSMEWTSEPPESLEELEQLIERGIQEIWEDTAREFSKKQGVPIESARLFLEQDAFQFLSQEFAGVLESFHSDKFGWILDECLKFAVDERDFQE